MFSASPRTRTLLDAVGISHLCQERKSAIYQEYRTRLIQFALGVAVVAAASAAVATAYAEDGIYIPLVSYRTGAAIFNGMSDYLNMLNARDGGVGGARLVVEECETGYDTKKGVECYDSTKGKNPVVSTPYSTGITLQLIPKAAVDRIPDFVDGLWPFRLGRRHEDS
jgi:hypothetical protein